MFASVRIYEGVDPAGADEIARKGREGLVPLLRQQPGFVDYYLVDSGDGVWATVTLFNDRAGAEKSATVASGWMRDALSHLVKTPPRVITGEVVANASRM